MGNYAKVINGKVTQVIVAEPEFFQTFIDTSPGEWIQTSYNTRHGIHYGQDGQPDGGPAIRKNFAGIGYSYNKELDAFIPPKEFDSWILNEEICDWEPPVAYPTDGKKYNWNESTQAWDLVPTE